MSDQILFYHPGKPYGWLSNFWHVPIEVDGKRYMSVEHYYQSMKAKDPKLKDWIADAPSAHFAYKIGHYLRTFEMVDGWLNKKSEVMLKGLRAKFNQNVELRSKLLATNGAVLHEDSPTDMFFGMKGQDVLGKLLMQVRDEINTEMQG